MYFGDSGTELICDFLPRLRPCLNQETNTVKSSLKSKDALQSVCCHGKGLPHAIVTCSIVTIQNSSAGRDSLGDKSKMAEGIHKQGSLAADAGLFRAVILARLSVPESPFRLHGQTSQSCSIDAPAPEPQFCHAYCIFYNTCPHKTENEQNHSDMPMRLSPHCVKD